MLLFFCSSEIRETTFTAAACFDVRFYLHDMRSFLLSCLHLLKRERRLETARPHQMAKLFLG